MDPKAFLAFAECVTDAMFMVTGQGVVIAANSAGLELLGQSQLADLEGCTLSQFVTTENGPLDDYLLACADSESPLAGVLKLQTTLNTQRILCQGRSIKLEKKSAVRILLRCLPQAGVGEHTPALLQLATEIERRRLVEQRLQKRELEARQHRERLVHVARLNTMGEMAAGIAHEVNQPLTAIATYAGACHRLLKSGLSDRDELLNTLDKINLQARRAGDIIQRLRSFVKKQNSQREAWDLNKLVADTMVLAETDARLHAFTIEMACCGQPLWVSVDPIQIQQVLLNLIRNGMDAMLEAHEADGCLWISAQQEDQDFARVAVRDQGIGIAPEQNDKLFSPFFTTKANGIGLGLSISRSIINAHGGQLKFERNVDKGVTMYFTLPLEIGTADG